MPAGSSFPVRFVSESLVAPTLSCLRVGAVELPRRPHSIHCSNEPGRAGCGAGRASFWAVYNKGIVKLGNSAKPPCGSPALDLGGVSLERPHEQRIPRP